MLTFNQRKFSCCEKATAAAAASSSSSSTVKSNAAHACDSSDVIGDNSYDCQSDERLDSRAVTHTLQASQSTEASQSPMYTQVRKKSALHSAASSSSPDEEPFPSEYTLLNESNSANGELDYRLILQLH